MTIALVSLSLLMAAIVGWLFLQTLNVQPWQAQAAIAQPVSAGTGRPAAQTALWVFLAVASSLFVLFVSAYSMRLDLADWTPLPRPRLLALNTALLVGASVAMQWALHAARRDDLTLLRRGLGLAGLLTAGFLAGQLAVWLQLNRAGFFVSSSVASAFFHLFTAVHGLHVLGGLVAWARAWKRAWREPGADGLRLSTQLCATYWHYLLAVWAVLYALLVWEVPGLAICSSTTL